MPAPIVSMIPQPLPSFKATQTARRKKRKQAGFRAFPNLLGDADKGLEVDEGGGAHDERVGREEHERPVSVLRRGAHGGAVVLGGEGARPGLLGRLRDDPADLVPGAHHLEDLVVVARVKGQGRVPSVALVPEAQVDHEVRHPTLGHRGHAVLDLDVRVVRAAVEDIPDGGWRARFRINMLARR